jgi:maltose O-acetyltransferase
MIVCCWTAHRLRLAIACCLAPKSAFTPATICLIRQNERQAAAPRNPITIGDRVWLAANVTVLPGVTIGANTVVGAGSVVTHDLPANVVAAGNPCQILHEITATDKTGFNGVDMG